MVIRKDIFWYLAGAAALAAWFALNIFRGNPQVDESLYIYKVRQVMHGVRLYRDVAWTQMPLFPYIFAVLLKISGFGLIQARMANMLFVVIAAAASAAIIRRELPGRNGALLWVAIFITPLTGYLLILVKHHALETAGVLSALLLLRRENIRDEIRLPAAMALFCIVGCIRAPYIAAPPVLFLWMAVFHRKRLFPVFLAALTGTLVFAVVYLLFVRGAADQARFGMWRLTAGLFPPPEGGRTGLMLMRLRYIETAFIVYLPVSGAAALAWLILIVRKGISGTFSFLWNNPWLLLTFGLPLTWISPCIFTNNPQTNWLICAVIVWGVGTASLFRELEIKSSLIPPIIAVFFITGFVLNFPFGFSKVNPLASLSESSRLVDQYVKANDVFFSCQLFEGTTSRGRLFPDSELSIFGFDVKLDAGSPRARKYHILTPDRLAHAMAGKELKALVLTDFYCPDFSRPPLRDALRANYRLLRKIPHYGQGQKDAMFFIPR